MSLETLWDRVNDAINTIIRRDESTETGELLPPCIEGTNLLFCVGSKFVNLLSGFSSLLKYISSSLVFYFICNENLFKMNKLESL